MTAKEFLESRHIEGSDNRCNAVIEFAKYHVKKALIQASEKVELMAIEGRWELSKDAEQPFDYVEDDLGNITTIDKDTILKAYNLDEIK